MTSTRALSSAPLLLRSSAFRSRKSLFFVDRGWRDDRLSHMTGGRYTSFGRGGKRRRLRWGLPAAMSLVMALCSPRTPGVDAIVEILFFVGLYFPLNVFYVVLHQCEFRKVFVLRCGVALVFSGLMTVFSMAQLDVIHFELKPVSTSLVVLALLSISLAWPVSKGASGRRGVAVARRVAGRVRRAGARSGRDGRPVWVPDAQPATLSGHRGHLDAAGAGAFVRGCDGAGRGAGLQGAGTPGNCRHRLNVEPVKAGSAWCWSWLTPGGPTRWKRGALGGN